MKKFNKDMTLGEVVAFGKSAEKILMGFEMHCFSCPMAQMETIEEASMVHGVDCDLVIAKLNELLEKKPDTKNKKLKSKKN